jgi:hypothetical protein
MERLERKAAIISRKPTDTIASMDNRKAFLINRNYARDAIYFF